MGGIIATLTKAALIALVAAFGVSVVHHNFLTQDASFGVGIGAFAIVGAFMLYRIWFWR
jgi:hypothetical protein